MSSDLTELFNRDPLHLTEGDVEQIIEGLRAAREQFAVEENTPKQKGQRSKSPKVPINLDDLEL